MRKRTRNPRRSDYGWGNADVGLELMGDLGLYVPGKDNQWKYVSPPLDIPPCVSFLAIGNTRFIQFGALPDIPQLEYDVDSITSLMGGPDPLKGLHAMKRALTRQRGAIATTAAQSLFDSAVAGNISSAAQHLQVVWEPDGWDWNKDIDVRGTVQKGMTPDVTLSYTASDIITSGGGSEYRTTTNSWGKEAFGEVLVAALADGLSFSSNMELTIEKIALTWTSVSYAAVLEAVTAFIREYVLSGDYEIPKYFGEIDWMPLSGEGQSMEIISGDNTALANSINCLWVYQQTYLALDENIKAVQAAIDAIMYSQHRVRLDEIAKEKGFSSWSELSATKDVENEWYCSIYDMPGCGPGEGLPSRAIIEAYKKMERDQYGKTSYEMELSGEAPEFIRIADNPEVRAVLERLIDKRQQELEIMLIAEEEALEEKKKAEADRVAQFPQKFLIGGLLVIGALAFLDRKRG